MYRMPFNARQYRRELTDAIKEIADKEISEIISKISVRCWKYMDCPGDGDTENWREVLEAKKEIEATIKKAVYTKYGIVE